MFSERCLLGLVDFAIIIFHGIAFAFEGLRSEWVKMTLLNAVLHLSLRAMCSFIALSLQCNRPRKPLQYEALSYARIRLLSISDFVRRRTGYCLPCKGHSTDRCRSVCPHKLREPTPRSIQASAGPKAGCEVQLPGISFRATKFAGKAEKTNPASLQSGIFTLAANSASNGSQLHDATQ